MMFCVKVLWSSLFSSLFTILSKVSDILSYLFIVVSILLFITLKVVLQSLVLFGSLSFFRGMRMLCFRCIFLSVLLSCLVILLSDAC